MKNLIRKKGKVGFIVALLCLLLGFFLLTKLQRTILFPTAYVSVSETLPPMEGSEVSKVESSDSSVDFVLLKSRSEEKSGVVIFAHGNGEAIDHWFSSFERYRKQGYHVALVEYRGFGRSTGDPSQVGITEDFVKAYDILISRSDVDPEKIIFHGRSLGGGVVCSLLRERKPAAMILESTFTSVEDMADSIFPFASLIVKDSFRSEEALGMHPDLPLLVFHGTQDSIVPVAHAHKLAGKISGSTLVLYEAGHNDFPPNRSKYWSEIDSFLGKL